MQVQTIISVTSSLTTLLWGKKNKKTPRISQRWILLNYILGTSDRVVTVGGIFFVPGFGWKKSTTAAGGGKEAKDLVPVSKLSISYQVLPSDLFGGFKWPFQGLSDLHLGYQKVTWKKLVVNFCSNHIPTYCMPHFLWRIVAWRRCISSVMDTWECCSYLGPNYSHRWYWLPSLKLT